MKEALSQQDKFDEFVIDDADDCILNHGTDLVGPFESPTLRCFTQLLRKKTFLITSATDFVFYDAMNRLGYLKKGKNDYSDVMNLGYKSSLPSRVKYWTFKNKLDIKDCMVKRVIERGGGTIVIFESMWMLKRF